MGRSLTAAAVVCLSLLACSEDGNSGGSANGGTGSGGTGSGGTGSGGTGSGGTGSGGASGSGGGSILTESCGDWVPTTESTFSIADMSAGQDTLFVAGSYNGVADLGVGSGSGQAATDTTGYVVALAESDLTPKWRFELFAAGQIARVFSVAALPDGDVLAIGGQREEGVGASLTLVRLSGADGSEVWRRTYATPYGNAFVPVFVRNYGASAYLFARLTKFSDEPSLQFGGDPWIAQLQTDGSFGWASSVPKPAVGLDQLNLVPTPDGDLALALSADDGTGAERRTSNISSVSSSDGGVNWTTTLDHVDLRRALAFGGNITVSAEIDGSSVDLGSGNISSFAGCPLIAYAPSSGSYVWHADVPGLSKTAIGSDLDLLATAGDFAYACSVTLTCGRYDQTGNVTPFRLFAHLPDDSIVDGSNITSSSAGTLYAAVRFRDRGTGVACITPR